MIKSESETQIIRKQIHCAIKQIIYNELNFTKQDIIDIIEKVVKENTEKLFHTYIRNNYSYHGALTDKLTKELKRDFGPTIKAEVANRLGKYIIGHVEIKSNDSRCDFNYDVD